MPVHSNAEMTTAVQSSCFLNITLPYESLFHMFPIKTGPSPLLSRLVSGKGWYSSLLQSTTTVTTCTTTATAVDYSSYAIYGTILGLWVMWGKIYANRLIPNTLYIILDIYILAATLSGT